MNTRQEFEAWAISVGVVLSTQEDGSYTYASMRFALDAYQAATSRQEAKIKALRKSLNWALSNFEEPFEWSTAEEDADAHREAMAAAKETT